MMFIRNCIYFASDNSIYLYNGSSLNANAKNGIMFNIDKLLNFRQSILLSHGYSINIKVENEYIIFKTLNYAVESIISNEHKPELVLILPDWLFSLNYGELLNVLKVAGSRLYLIPESIFLVLDSEIETGNSDFKISCGALKYWFEVSKKSNNYYIEVIKIDNAQPDEKISNEKIIEKFQNIQNCAYMYRMFIKKKSKLIVEVNDNGIYLNENEGYEFNNIKKIKVLEMFDKYPVLRILFDFNSEMLEKNIADKLEAKIFRESDKIKINIKAGNELNLFNKAIKLNNNISGVIVYDAVE